MSTGVATRGIAGAAVLAAAVSGSALAQDPAMEQLRRELESAKATIRQMEKRLEAMEAAAAKPPAGATATAAPVTTGASPSRPAAPAAGASPAAVEAVFVPAQRYNDDQYGDPRPGGADVAAARKGFVALPGTETGLRIGGFIKLDAMYDASPVGTRDWFVPATIPVTAPDNQRGPQFGMTARASRLNFEFRRSTELGLVKIFLENDFFGDDAANFKQGPYGFRLRHAYGQVGRWTAGRTFTNFMDIDSWPDTLEFYGPNAATFLFNAQVRYTHPLREGLSLAGAMETPRTDITCNAAPGCGPRERFPDLTAKLRWEQGWGHMQLSGIVRQLAWDSGVTGAGSETGAGVQFSGSWKTGIGRDYLVWSVLTGRGIQRYVNDPGYFGGNDGVLGPQGQFDNLGVAAGFVGYTHFWDDRLRSTVSGGLVDAGNSSLQPVTAFDRTGYYTANLIWNAFGSLNVGTELVYGTNRARDGSRGDALRLMLSAQYNFVR